MPSRNLLEVCIASVDDALAAEEGGADRLELNVALELGGLTPSIGLFLEVKQSATLPVIVMIRPRGAGFCYSPCERSLMLRDAEHFLQLGADGVAAGALHRDRTLDLEFWKTFVHLAGQRQVVFHRAFDVVESPDTVLEQLIDLGTTRVLTSGGQQSALAGAPPIARLKRRAGQRIEILPGAGVTPDNIIDLVRSTGCDQVHGSFGKCQQDIAGFVTGETYPVTDPGRVAAARRALDRA